MNGRKKIFDLSKRPLKFNLGQYKGTGVKVIKEFAESYVKWLLQQDGLREKDREILKLIDEGKSEAEIREELEQKNSNN